MAFKREKKTLTEVATEAGQFSQWSQYAEFCLQYERGVRSKAFSTLDQFITTLERAPFGERRQFVSWLMHQIDGVAVQHRAMPYQLRLRIVEPTLTEWTAIEPNQAEPHLWLGGYEHLKLALDLDSGDQSARTKLILCLLSSVGTYLLPRHYDGDPYRDLNALDEAKLLLDAVQDQDDRRELFVAIEEERALILAYLKSQ